MKKIGELYKDKNNNLFVKTFCFEDGLQENYFYQILSYKKVMPSKETIKEKSIY